MSFKNLNGAPTHYYKMKTTVFSRWTVEDCATHLLPHLEPHFRILNLECGPGSIALDLVRLISHGSVVGIDVSAGMPKPTFFARIKKVIQRSAFPSQSKNIPIRKKELKY